MLLLPCLFKVRPLVLSKTLSQMWDRVNFTYVIVKCGIVNPNVNGFLDVVPLPPYYLEVVMVSRVACLAAVMMNGRGGFRCSLYLSPKVLEVSPMYSSSHVRSPHWYQ